MIKIKDRFDDAEVYHALLSEGDEYLPEEIEGNCITVTGYSDVFIKKEFTDDTRICGTCAIECEKDEEEFVLDADFVIKTDKDGTINDIEFTVDEDNFA